MPCSVLVYCMVSNDQHNTGKGDFTEVEVVDTVIVVSGIRKHEQPLETALIRDLSPSLHDDAMSENGGIAVIDA